MGEKISFILHRKGAIYIPLIILALAVFFRFYNFEKFQYLSLDEELLIATVRHIVWNRTPALLVQNVAVEFGLGPFYHWFLAPFFFITNFNLVLLGAIGSFLGVVTTFLVFKTGEVIGGKKLAYLAGFFYATSFFISLFERRLVHLTLDPLMSAIAVFGLVQVVKKEYAYIPLLAIPIGFSFHADPSLAILTIAVLAAFIVFKLPLLRRPVIYFLIILGVFMLPFVAVEARHRGVVVGPVIHSLSKPFTGARISPTTFFYYSPIEFINVFSRIILTGPSNFAEKNFEYSRHYDMPLFSPLAQILVVLIFILHLKILFKSRGLVRKYSLVLWIFLLSFIFGILVFNLVFKGSFYQHYFMIIFPVFILILAQVISVQKKAVMVSIVFLYFLINFYTLLNSSVKYPLYAKIDMVKKSLAAIGNHNFSIHASGSTWVLSGGWTELYTLQKHPAVKSFSYDYLDWVYRAYSLYPTKIQADDPERVVWILGGTEPLDSQLPVIASYNLKDIKLYVLDNSAPAGKI